MYADMVYVCAEIDRYYVNINRWMDRQIYSTCRYLLYMFFVDLDIDAEI